MADRSYIERNRASSERLDGVLARLDDDAARREVRDGWTVGGLLGHLAFWDRLVTERWALAGRSGEPTPVDLPDVLTDLINDAARPGWQALSAAALAGLVATAAGDVDAAVAAVPDASVDAVLAEGRPRLLDRSIHRGAHLDDVERALRS